jgi:protein kinase A
MGNCSSSSSVNSLPDVTTKTSQKENAPDPVLNRDQNDEDAPTTINLVLNQNQTNTQTDSYLERAKHEFETKYANPSTKTAKIEDFQLQRPPSTSLFARIMPVKHGNQSLALKIMEKHSIVKSNQVERILSEKRILQAINSPFIVNLIYAFKDNARLYLAFEFVSGGEMFYNLR